MEVIKIPFLFDREEFDKRIRIELYEGMEEEIDALIGRSVPLIEPVALYRELGVGRGETGGFQIEDQIFDDQVTAGHFEGLDRIFPYVATCGPGLEDMLNSGVDMLEIFWIDALKQMAMDRAFDALRGEVKSKYAIEHLYSLNPGSDTCREGWDIQNLSKIFKLMPNAESLANVQLTDSLLMLPNKTVAGFLFKSHKDFVTCLDCDNINCSNRRMIHDGAIVS